MHMGGYAPYVWSSYGLAALLLIINIVLPRRAEQAALRRLARREALGENHDTTA
ncbi:MAG: heme exporter protein CcmD [Proteobacteria bacterium]|nr:heme exporter protein CcmD [Pseudomonadota bacterium]MBK8961243.1 heme exporter protein CcmD [Pseudomonadota bacterium]